MFARVGQEVNNDAWQQAAPATSQRFSDESNVSCRRMQLVSENPTRNAKPLALFTSKNFCKIGTVALSFVFDKYCSIID